MYLFDDLKISRRMSGVYSSVTNTGYMRLNKHICSCATASGTRPVV